MTPNPILKKRSGIYGILSHTTGKIYVGKTGCMWRRCGQYLYDYKNRASRQLNDYLYNAIRKRGLEDFEFFPLEFAPIDVLAERELYWILRLRANEREHGYNLRLDSSTGMIASDETKAKISNTIRKQWADGVRDDHGDKLRANWAAQPDRKIVQAELFSKTLTRYIYEVISPDGTAEVCNYKRLSQLGLKNVVANFHRRNSDDVTCKGYRVKRFTV